MLEFVRIAAWVLGSAGICLTVGYYLGSSRKAGQASKESERERNVALQAMTEVLRAVEQLTHDVDDRNLEIRQVGRHVGGLQVAGDLENVRQTLLGQVANVLKSNQRLEHDLCHARCRMEEQSQELDRTRREALTDALSGVANRKAFDERFRLLMTDFYHKSKPFVLVLADLDHFKWINDTHGHPAGDLVLNEFGKLLKRATRERDFVARFGGDEFAVLLPNTVMEEGKMIADRILAATQQTNFAAGSDMELAALTASFGVTEAMADDTCETMLHRGDQALYRSKNSGRNQIQYQRSAGEMVECIADESQAASR